MKSEILPNLNFERRTVSRFFWWKRTVSPDPAHFLFKPTNIINRTKPTVSLFHLQIPIPFPPLFAILLLFFSRNLETLAVYASYDDDYLTTVSSPIRNENEDQQSLRSQFHFCLSSSSHSSKVTLSLSHRFLAFHFSNYDSLHSIHCFS